MNKSIKAKCTIVDTSCDILSSTSIMSSFCQKALVFADIRLRQIRKKLVFNMHVEKKDIKIFNKTRTITRT